MTLRRFVQWAIERWGTAVVEAIRGVIVHGALELFSALALQ